VRRWQWMASSLEASTRLPRASSARPAAAAERFVPGDKGDTCEHVPQAYSGHSALAHRCTLTALGPCSCLSEETVPVTLVLEGEPRQVLRTRGGAVVRDQSLSLVRAPCHCWEIARQTRSQGYCVSLSGGHPTCLRAPASASS